MGAERWRENVLGAIGDAARNCPLPTREKTERLEVGSYYEINHSKLPRSAPDVLHSLRAVVVSTKTEQNVTIRYPSFRSLDEFFGGKANRSTTMSKLSPETDERYFMGPKLAVEVLGRKILNRECLLHSHSKSFWLNDRYKTDKADCNKTDMVSLPPSVSGGRVPATTDSNSKYGACFSKLQSCGIKGWGTRQTQILVSYAPYKQFDVVDEAVSTLSHGDGKESLKEETKVTEGPTEEHTQNTNDTEGSKEEHRQDSKVTERPKEELRQETGVPDSPKEEHTRETDVSELVQYTRKRKPGRPRLSPRKKRKIISKKKRAEIKLQVENTQQKPLQLKPKMEGNAGEKSVEAKPKVERQLKERTSHQLKPKVEKKEGGHVDRWSATRYEVAAKKLVEVLKANNAVFGNPIPRSKLRAEARKKIGDTGLLDHLLKHLSGEVVPTGGVDRLRRRCDAEGKMDYWLESSDLINIRKQAGVNDPYWSPPLGWKPGDCISPHTCICCKEVMALKDELSNLKRQIPERVFNDENQHAISLLLTETAASPGRFNYTKCNIKSSKASYETLAEKKSVLEEQLLKTSQALVELEADMKKLLPKLAAEEDRSSLLLSYSKNLPVEEIDEMNGSSSEELSIERTKESSENDDEVERDSEATNGEKIVRLKPCRRASSTSNLTCDAVERSKKDPLSVAHCSASPHPSTTS